MPPQPFLLRFSEAEDPALARSSPSGSASSKLITTTYSKREDGDEADEGKSLAAGTLTMTRAREEADSDAALDAGGALWEPAVL